MTRWPLAALMALALAAPASAAETAAPPSHLVNYHLDWLNYLDPADVPAVRPAICLVDSGVLTTPDTPNGTIIAKLAVDGGSGEPERSDDPAYLHGTRMAMAMAAPQNDWGTIGTWAGAQIVSVRATTAGESTFRPTAYRQGIDACVAYAADHGLSLATVNLSLGCGGCALTEEQRTILEDRIQRAHKNGASVLAAAGNDAGPVQVPGSVVGAFAVGAGDTAGELCSYGSFGPEVAMLGPACPVNSADPMTGEPTSLAGGGSSAATAMTSTLIAALHTLRPDSTWAQAEAWVRDSARVVAGRSALDGEAAARLAGLGAVVDRARARQPVLAPAPTSTPTTIHGAETGPGGVGGQPRSRLPRPHVIFARWRGGWLTVEVTNRPARARLAIVAQRFELDAARQGRRRALARGSRVHLRLRWRPQALRVMYRPRTDEERPSEVKLLYRHGHRYR